MAADGSIVIDTKIDDKNLNKELKKMKAALGKGLAVAAKASAVALAGIAVAIGAIAKGAQQFAKITDRVDKLSQRIGISRTAFQEWDFILSQTGTSAEGLEMAVKTLSRAADEAAQGTESYADAFNRLGVSIVDTNGNMKTQEQLFKDTFSALSDLENETERTAIASEVLGRSATQLAPAFNQGSEAIERMRQEAHDLGLIMSDDVIDAGVILTDNLDKLRRVGKGLFVEVFSGIVPALNNATTALAQWVAGQGGVAGIADKIRGFFQAMGVGIQKIWVSIIGFIQGLFTKYVAGLQSDMANIKMAFTVAINGIKIGFLSLAQIIADKVLGGVAKLLEVMSKLPFVGEKFAEASAAVQGFNENLGNSIQSAKDASAAAIQAAINEKNAVMAEAQARIAAQEAATAARLKAIDEEASAATAARQAELEAQRAALLEEARANQIKKQSLERQQELISLQGEYAQAVALANQQAADGFITQEEAQEEATEAAQRYADALYKIGVNAETAAEDGGAALREMLGILSKGPAVVEATDSGDTAAENVAEGFIDGLTNRIGMVVDVTKRVLNTIGNVFLQGFALLGRAATFDPAALVESLREFADGLLNFFMTDLGSLPVFIDMAVGIIENLVNGLEDNLPAIKETVKNLIAYMVEVISENGPSLLASALEIGEALLTSILSAFTENKTELVKTIVKMINQISAFLKKNTKLIADGAIELVMALIEIMIDTMPDAVDAAIEFINVFTKGLIDNAGTIINAIVQILLTIFNAIIENLDTMIELGIEMMVAVSKGISENISPIITAIIDALPEIIMAIIGALPEFILAGGEIGYALIKGIVEAIINSPKALADAAYKLFWGFINYVKDLFGIHSPSTVFMDIGKDIIQGLINGLFGMIRNLWSKAADIGGAIIDGILSGLSAMFDNLKRFVTQIVNWVIGAFNGMLDNVGGIFGGIGDFFGDAFGGAGDFFGDAWGGVTDFFGGLFANGTNFAPGGLSIVGERGPELMNVPKGSQITPSGRTMSLLSGMQNGINSALSSTMGMSGQTISVNVNGVMDVDGEAIGRISFEYLDKMAGIA